MRVAAIDQGTNTTRLLVADVMDTRIKASFGTALKLFDYKHLGHSSAMAIATVLVFLLTPPTKIFVENISARSLWTGLHQRLLHDIRGVDPLV